MFDDEYYMKLALQEAQKAYDAGEVPVGAIVVCDQKIIAKTHNLTETLNDVSAHAEMMAITSAAENLGGKYLHGCTLYVTLEPCLMCAGALYWSQLSTLVFGARDQSRGFMSLEKPILHPKTVVRSGVLENSCGDLMLKFFKARR